MGDKSTKAEVWGKKKKKKPVTQFEMLSLHENLSLHEMLSLHENDYIF